MRTRCSGSPSPSASPSTRRRLASEYSPMSVAWPRAVTLRHHPAQPLHGHQHGDGVLPRTAPPPPSPPRPASRIPPARGGDGARRGGGKQVGQAFRLNRACAPPGVEFVAQRPSTVSTSVTSIMNWIIQFGGSEGPAAAQWTLCSICSKASPKSWSCQRLSSPVPMSSARSRGLTMATDSITALASYSGSRCRSCEKWFLLEPLRGRAETFSPPNG